MVRKRFRARLEPTPGGGAVCHLAFDVKAIFGHARAPVRVKINGHEFRTTVAWMGNRYLLGVNKRHRAGAGIDFGDLFTVTMELDTEPRVVELPPDLAASLEGQGLRAAWERMSYTHQREYAEWIVEAKRPETRALRVLRTVQLIDAKWKAASPPDSRAKASAKKTTAKKAAKKTTKKTAAKKTGAKKTAAKKTAAKKTAAKKTAAKKTRAKAKMNEAT